MRKTALTIGVFALVGLVSLACTVEAKRSVQEGHEMEHASDLKKLVAVMVPTANSDTKGTCVFTQTDEGVRVECDITGLEPDSTHAIHIHEFGDLRSEDGTSAGGHYNPQGHEHGLPSKEERHAGDLGNLEADAEGKARYVITVRNVTLNGTRNPILGRGVIIHEKSDDGGQPTGNAGGRISMGVIGVAKP